MALNDEHRAILDHWLGEWEVVDDLSWPQGITTLRVRSAEGDSIVKASETSAHIAREIDAYAFLANRFAGRIPRFQRGDREHRILLVTYLDGELAQGTDAEWDPDIYEQAGRFLAELQTPGEVSSTYLSGLVAKTHRSLEHAGDLIPAAHASEIRRRLAVLPTPAVRLSFTHGDWHARNWLVAGGQLRVIDFGRGGQRHWVHDLIRLESQQFFWKPELRVAFHHGMGVTLSDTDRVAFEIEHLNQAVGTVPWAHEFADPQFEELGREMIRRIVDG